MIRLVLVLPETMLKNTGRASGTPANGSPTASRCCPVEVLIHRVLPVILPYSLRVKFAHCMQILPTTIRFGGGRQTGRAGIPYLMGENEP